MAEFQVVPADAGRWADLTALFGRSGASNGCWCQYWLRGAGYHRRDRTENRRDLRRQVRTGAGGLLAYRDGAAVAWARFSPRADLPWLTARFDRFGLFAPDAWALPCFYVARQARGSGAMRALIRYAARWGRAAGVPVEGYPIDPDVPGATGNRFSGVLPAFRAERFVEVGRIGPDRALVRYG